ncbi:MAG: heme o synthase [Actinomycetota bacterium]
MKRLVVSESTGALRVEDLTSSPPLEELGAATLADRLRAYIALTKPRIIELLLVTTVPAMILAAQGLPSIGLIVATLLGGTLSAAGANAINCYLDRDIDAVMPRTKRRPLPTHRITPRSALAFGSALGIIALVWMWVTINAAAAFLSFGALLFYVFIYTLALKRSTPQNIVIGGAAGAAPVLVGWAAVTGTIDLPAIGLFGIIFYWTPPHFWALSMRYEKEYAAAGVPMMPVVYGRRETTRHVLLYSFILLAMCLVLFSVAQMGMVYLGATVILNAVFVGWAIRLWRNPSPKLAWGLFRFSIYYLAFLFLAIALDVLIST